MLRKCCIIKFVTVQQDVTRYDDHFFLLDNSNINLYTSLINLAFLIIFIYHHTISPSSKASSKERSLVEKSEVDRETWRIIINSIDPEHPGPRYEEKHKCLQHL